ncbi:MAG: hypothetical protein FJX95_08925, partial [Bacteroidetes bacterium]|nr:hypothetical protein [Bacteroidota bacterium]
NKTFDVDHILPFSHFRNNDFWNLMPANPSVNRSKNDKLPTPEMLDNSKDRLLYVWSQQEQKYPDRFIAEALRFTGLRVHKNPDLFDCLRESISLHINRLDVWEFERT